MKYYIDFGGWCEVEADSANEAETEFWRRTQEHLPLDNVTYEIEGVEQKDED